MTYTVDVAGHRWHNLAYSDVLDVLDAHTTASGRFTVYGPDFENRTADFRRALTELSAYDRGVLAAVQTVNELPGPVWQAVALRIVHRPDPEADQEYLAGLRDGVTALVAMSSHRP